jgi:hypothetical protein
MSDLAPAGAPGRLRSGLRAISWALTIGFAASIVQAYAFDLIRHGLETQLPPGPAGDAAAMAALVGLSAAAVFVIALGAGALAAPGFPAAAAGGLFAAAFPALVGLIASGSFRPDALDAARAVLCTAAGLLGEWCGTRRRRR